MKAIDKPQCCIRIDPVLYKKIKLLCVEGEITINQFVLDAISDSLKNIDKIMKA